MCGKVGVCFDEAFGSVDLDDFAVVSFPFVPVYVGEGLGGQVVDDEAFDSVGTVGYGIKVDVVRTNPSVCGQEGGFGQEGFSINSRRGDGKTEAAD